MQPKLQLASKEGKVPLPSKRQAVLILGMHRSGTSAVGGVISALGAAAPKTLLPGNSGNPRGYWESLYLEQANNDLLASAGSRWDDWRPLNPHWIGSEAAKGIRRRLTEIIADEFASEPLFFIKDPRMCRFVPLMCSILAELKISPVALLPVRNPLEVAYSLKRRDEIPLPKSLLLWLRHGLDAEFHSRGMPRYFLPHEGFLLDWRYHVNRAAQKTGIIWPAQSAGSDAKVEQFLTMDLYRERATLEDIGQHPNITALIQATYAALTKMATDGESEDLRDELDLLRTKFDEGCELFGAALAAEELAREQLRTELNVLAAEAETLREVNSKLAAVSEQQSQHIRGLDAERNALAKAQAITIAARDALTRETTVLIAERDALIREKTALIVERDAVARPNSDLVAERDSFAAANANLVAERDALARAHSELIAERDSLLAAQGDLVAERDALRWAHNDLAAEREALTKVPGKLIRERDALVQAHSDLTAERDALVRVHSDLINQRDRLLSDRDTVLGERDALVASRSWKLTAPLRQIRRLFTFKRPLRP